MILMATDTSVFTESFLSV